MRKARKRDPLKTSPLREPGLSTREHLLELALDKVVMWIIIAVVAAVFASIEWARWYLKAPYTPIAFSLIAFIALAVALWRAHAARQQLANYRLGIRGERATGQFLENELRPLGFQVFHDLVEEGYNIDHVLIGPPGVFAVETKTISKPEKGQIEVTFDGEHILINGDAPERDPVIQAKASARRVRHIVKEYTGTDVPVRPVVLFPGWWVDESGNDGDLWVLNEERLIGYLRKESVSLSSDRVKFLAANAARYIRDRQKC